MDFPRYWISTFALCDALALFQLTTLWKSDLNRNDSIAMARLAAAVLDVEGESPGLETTSFLAFGIIANSHE